MKFIKDKAIIIESIDVQGADKLVSFFTAHQGLVKGIAQAARQLKSRFLPCFELLNIVEIAFVQKENKDLVSISECEVKSSLSIYGEKPDYYFFIFYVAELAKEFALEGYKNAQLYNILSDVHYGIKKQTRLKLLARWIEIQLLNEHGIFPELTVCTTCKRDLQESNCLKFISLNGELKCEQCKNINDIELQNSIFLLMNKLLCAKIAYLNALNCKDVDLNKVGAILKLILQKHLDKTLKFYGFYKQLYVRKI